MKQIDLLEQARNLRNLVLDCVEMTENTHDKLIAVFANMPIAEQRKNSISLQ